VSGIALISLSEMTFKGSISLSPNNHLSKGYL